jgi:hypothetical protein
MKTDARRLQWEQALDDIEGLIAEVMQAQPMHPGKRGTLLGRLCQVRATLTELRDTEKELIK